jgi:hypothetical protein
MAHDLELSVGDQVYLGETWALTSTDYLLAAVRYLSEILQPRLIDVDSFIHGQICNWLSSLQTLRCASIWPSLRIYRHFPNHAEKRRVTVPAHEPNGCRSVSRYPTRSKTKRIHMEQQKIHTYICKVRTQQGTYVEKNRLNETRTAVDDVTP